MRENTEIRQENSINENTIEKGILNTSNIEKIQSIENAPEELYYKGNIELLNKGIVAVVGSRKCSTYAKNICKIFVRKMVENGLVIASGLALGIDEIAHKSSIENGGKTIAILAGGIDKIYPEENIELAENILETNGLIISEKNFSVDTMKKNFPKRNRIISGISSAVLIVESAYRSGSNITARYAIKQNKKLFVIPHNVGTKGAGGMKRLIEWGAKVVYNPDEIIEQLGDIYNKEKLDIKQKQKYEDRKKQELEDELFEIYKIISKVPIDANYISRITKKQIKTINYSLVDLELRGYIKKLPGNKYVINNE